MKDQDTVKELHFNPKWILKRTLSIISNPSIIILRIHTTAQLESQAAVFPGFKLILTLKIKCRTTCIQHLKLNSLSATTAKCWMPPRALRSQESEKVIIFSCECQQLPKCDLGPDLWVVWPLQMAPAIIMHQGNLFWFWALICESLMASLTGASKEQGGNSGELDIVIPVAKVRVGGFTWQRDSGTQGWESLLWHNHPHPHGSGWASCHSNRHGNYPPDFPFWLFRVQHCEVWEPLFQCASIKSRWVFSLITPEGWFSKIPSFEL